MSFLWERDSATAAQIVDDIARRRDISMRTIKALIRRLVDKNMISFTVDERDSRVYHYKALVSREQSIEDKNRSVLDLVHGGKAGDLVTNFVETAALEAEEIDHLLSLLEKKKSGLKRG